MPVIVWVLLLLPLLWNFAHAQQNVSETIYDDIRNALKIVTNDSHLLQHIIPEMYGTTMQQSSNLTFIFYMPNEIDSKNTEYTMLQMQRSDFVDPIFPNVTTEDIGMADEQQHDTIVNLKTNENWSNLGLPGWIGELTRPLPLLELNHKDAQYVDETFYPRDEILLNIKHGNFNGLVKDIKVISHALQQQTDNISNSIENVYIARVNDPFGYSVMWQLKNATQNTTTTIATATEQRSKRDVVRLYSMIKCSTGCDPIVYKGYGCFCGIGGFGIPADGIDRCCRQHDKCYEYSNCISYLEYFVPYVWKCFHGKPLCAIDHGEWGGPDSCAARLCQCDLRLSRCLRKFLCPQRRAVCRSSRARRLQNLIFFD